MSDANLPLWHIRPSRGWAGLGLGELWAYRDVLGMLMARDIKLRYRQTFFGVAWVVLQPVLAGVLFAIIFGRFARLPSGGLPYVLFVFAGLLGWNLFAGIVQRAGASLVQDAKLVTKVYFPRLLVPCAAAGAVCVDFLVSLLVMAVLLAWHGVWPGWSLALAPVAVFSVLLIAFGLGIWVAALNVRYRDFMYALPFAIQVTMYATPVVYGLELVPVEWRGVFSLNPLVGAMETMRAALVGANSAAPWWAVPWTLISGGAILVSGVWFFRRVEDSLADDL